MSKETPSVDAVFCAAIEIDVVEERDAYVHRACGDDEKLKGRVRKLIDAHFRSGSFLEDRAPGLEACGGIPPISEGPGSVIDRYKLLEQIGEGGMGLVFMAQQLEPVKRKVALKIIKPGMDTRQVIARFEAEQQALALMDHPNIARVLDAGITPSPHGGKGDGTDLCEAPEGPSRQISPVPFSTGRPYFVMELVKGIPITEYCDRNGLTPRERLELFVPVCQAVQHAHQKGIIHRDIKPTNVLVTLHDGTPVVKVIDFGVAKAIDRELTERSLFTNFAQIVGTPLYMSPEQAELSGLDVDTRTDVYSLGVLLYELLTGVTPFDRQRLHEAAFDEMRRIIREEEPPKPSTRISTLGESLSSVSEHRKTEPKRLTAQVRGDLDWIAMKALEKDRTRRYETASEFAADVNRFLQNEAIEARPPSAFYRFRKFARRNKAAMTTVGLVAVSLILGIVLTTWQAVRATYQSERAAKAERELFDAFDEFAQVQTDQWDYVDAEKGYRRVWESRCEVLGERHPETLKTRYRLATVIQMQDRLQDAVVILNDLLADQRTVLGRDDPGTSRTANSLQRAREELARRRRADSDEPLIDLRRSVELFGHAFDVGDSPDAWPPWASFVLATAQSHCGRPDEALESLKESLSHKVDGVIHPPLFAVVHAQLGDRQLARDWLTVSRNQIGITGWPDPGGRSYAAISEMKNKATSLLDLPSDSWLPGHETPRESVEMYTRLIQLYPGVAFLFSARGRYYACLGDWEKGAADFDRAAECRPDWLDHRMSQGVVYLYLGDLQEYKEVCGEAFSEFAGDGGVDTAAGLVQLCTLSPEAEVDPDTLAKIAGQALSRKSRAEVRLAQGMLAYRRGAFQDVLEIVPEENRGNTPVCLAFRAMAHYGLGDHEKAREELDEARREMHQRLLPKEQWLPLNYNKSGPLLWCKAQVVLQEAETLIRPTRDQSEDALTTEGTEGAP